VLRQICHGSQWRRQLRRLRDQKTRRKKNTENWDGTEMQHILNKTETHPDSKQTAIKSGVEIDTPQNEALWGGLAEDSTKFQGTLNRRQPSKFEAEK